MPAVLARRVLTPGGWIGPAAVEISDGFIVRIAPTSAPTPDVSLVPGFVDVQVNGIDDVDVFHATGDGWQRLADLLLDQGVTAWCPTVVTNRLDRFAEPFARVAAEQARADADRPTILGVHLEGPFLGGAPGAHRRDLLSPIDLDWLGSLPEIVRLVTLAPELDHAAAAITALTARGVVVSLGHSAPSAANVEVAIGAGATMLTHLFNGMSGVHHREPGLAAIGLTDDRLAVGLIADLVHVHPTALRLAFRAKPDGLVVLVTDAVGWRVGSVGEMRMAIADGAPRLPDGTLAGSALRMDQAVRNLVLTCDVPLDQVARAASSNPARVLGCTDRGTIAVGQRADLVALDDGLRVGAVWLTGQQVR